jgi:glycosyltransferase involved in cell wall biosynthesis
VGIPLPPGVVIPNGLDAEDAVGVSDTDSGERSTGAVAPLLYLGRVSWEKGLDRLIPALVSVPEATLLIAGNDENAYRDTLQALAERCGVRDRIQFLGAVGELEKRKLLRAASMLVLPSYSENFGNVVLEAMALGCPVVVTEEVGLADAVRESGAGIVVHGEPQLLGAAIAKLLQDRGEREAMGLRGRQTVRERFSWVAIARQMEDAYLSAIARSEPRQAPRVAE